MNKINNNIRSWLKINNSNLKNSEKNADILTAKNSDLNIIF